MKKYKLYLIDLDGTIYRGKDTISSGVRFVKRLEKHHLDYLFLTNNTTRTPQMVVKKLRYHGVYTNENCIYTPSMATASYLLQKITRPVKVFIIGQAGLYSEILSHPELRYDEVSPDYVIVGMDTDLTYHKIRLAVTAIRNGAKFICTNADLNLPAGNELLPGNGSQCAMITAASGQKPFVVGKPEKLIIEKALELKGCRAKDALIIGDNYDTDILAGINANVDQLLTLTGVTKESDLNGKRLPTCIVNNLDEVDFNATE